MPPDKDQIKCTVTKGTGTQLFPQRATYTQTYISMWKWRNLRNKPWIQPLKITKEWTTTTATNDQNLEHRNIVPVYEPWGWATATAKHVTSPNTEHTQQPEWEVTGSSLQPFKVNMATYFWIEGSVRLGSFFVQISSLCLRLVDRRDSHEWICGPEIPATLWLVVARVQ